MKRTFKILILTVFMLCLTVAVSVSVSASEVSCPDISCVTGTESNFNYEVIPYETGGDLYFFLPGTSDLSALTFKYSGNWELHIENSVYRTGDTFTVNASDGKFSVTEYNASASDVQFRDYEFTVMKGGNIGSVYITLDDGTKALKKIHTSKQNTEPGDIIVANNVGTVLYDGRLKKIKGHGLTSFIASGSANEKNSYNFNLESKAELINGAGKMKKYVLLSPRRNASDRDTTGLSQLAAFHAFSGIIGNSRATIEGEYVDLYINGEYRGLYILTERMNNKASISVTDLEDLVTPAYDYKTNRDDRKNNGRDPALNAGIHKYTYDRSAKIDSTVDITGGYVLEVMCEDYDGCGFETKHGVDINIKSPEICTKEMVQYIAEYVQQFENALYSSTGYNSEGKHYTEYIDEKSLADLVLVYSHYINFEYFRTSTYIYKDADGQPNDTLTFGPAWDFETGAYFLESDTTLFGTTNYFVYFVDQQYAWSEQLWQHGDFMTLLSEENEKLRGVLAQLNGIDSSTTTPSLKSIVENALSSASMSDIRWGLPKYKALSSSFIKAAQSRYDTWYDVLWNPDEYLISADVEISNNDDGTVTLSAVITGKHDAMIKWYKISAKSPDKPTIFMNGKDSITVEADGSVYYYTVSGPNNAYYQYAAGEIFSNKTLTMKSSNMEAVRVQEPEPETTAPIETEDTENIGGNDNTGCGTSLSSVVIIFTSVFGTALLKKRK